MKNILIYFDFDKRPSPFDILFAYDVGFDIVHTYAGVGPEDITPLVQDAMFPRGPQGAQFTTIFIGGSDLAAVEEMAKKAKKTVFPPFQLSIAVDPKGSYTTSSAMAAKIMEVLRAKGDKLEGKKAAVLGGCGKVGLVTSRILAAEEAEVKIVDVVDAVDEVAESIFRKVGKQVKGVKAVSAEEVLSAAGDCEIVISAGPAGVEILPEGALKKLGKCLVAADVNAVPPAGIAGIKPDYDKKEVDGTLVLGALAIGNLRNKIQTKIFSKAMESVGAYLDYTDALKLAKEKLGL